ncbi:hypothetical protein, partial [Larkinella soli]|uniref:hypothetical protein n=1 Tax=Larkinella soli TaxID=1770527 RepID=UPI0013E334ED
WTTNPQLLRVYLLLKDLTKPQLDLYLSLRLEGPGVLIRSRPDFRPAQPLTLSPGIPLMLAGPDLADYLSANALEGQGLPADFLTRGGRLPEGLYTLTVEAFEWDRDRQPVSNAG